MNSPVWTLDDPAHNFARLIPPRGFITDYVREATPRTDAPPPYHITTALAGMSIVAAPLTDLVAGVDHPLHLFMLLIGDSSGSRKSSSIRRMTEVIEPVLAKNGMSDRIWRPTVSSPEGMTDELIREPNRLLCYNEWTQVAGISRAGYWQHATDFFNSLYDANSKTTRARSNGKITVIIRPRTSILAGSTPSLVNGTVSAYGWKSGMLARYLVCCANRPTDKWMPQERPFPSEVLLHLQSQVERITAHLHALSGLPNASEAKIHLTHEAETGFNRWARKIEDQRHLVAEHLDPSYSRAGEHAMRVAALYEVSQLTEPGLVRVSGASMEAACHFVDFCLNSMREVFELPGSGNPNELASGQERVLAVLKNAGRDGIRRREILRRVRAVSAKTLDDIIDTLLQAELVEGKEDASTGGRPGTRYFFHRDDAQ